MNGEKIYSSVPEAEIPVFPVLSFSSLFSFFSKKPKNVLDHGYTNIPVIAARYAIAQALKHMNISSGDEILIPAYHCTVMVEPIIKMSCKPVFYKITSDLNTDLVDVNTKITPRTKAIIAVNYCGFVQNMAEVKSLCKKSKIILIEDCAHSFFGQKEGITVGGHGDYILVSARKFFPVEEGGALLIRHNTQNLPNQKSQKLVKTLKSYLALIERSLKYGKLWLFAPLVEIFNFLRNIFKTAAPEKQSQYNPALSSPEQSFIMEGENAYFHNLMDKKTTLINRLLPNILVSTKMTKRRRQNYLWLSHQFSKIPHCRLLIENLPEGIVPFMLPIYIENLEKYFAAIEKAALPSQRFAQFLWPGVTEEVCPVTADYSKNVILFPCHQELCHEDMQWLVSTVRNILEQK